MPRTPTELPAAIVAQLGNNNISDADLARQAGVTSYIIHNARARHARTTPAPVTTVAESIRRAFRKATVGKDGMVIPFDAFAQAAIDALK
jgi:hypothetical protein